MSSFQGEWQGVRQHKINNFFQFSIIINSPVMLLNTHKRKGDSIPFHQELAHLKYYKQPTTASKNTEYFQTMTSVLDLLLQSYPAITSEVLTLKQAIKKWHDHIQNEAIDKSRQLMEMRQNLVVYVSQQIGVTLEEIGYYVKHFTDNYRDQDMRRLYFQYLNAIKKLEWNHDPPTPQYKHQSIQTNEEPLFSDLPTIRTISGHRVSQQTLDSPISKYKDFDIHKYIKAKEESLELERKVSQMTTKISDLEAENKGLKREIERVHDEYQQCQRNRDKELQEITKLKQLLSTLKQEEQSRLEREMEKTNSFNAIDKKYDQCGSIKNALHHSLQIAEMEILQKQSMKDYENQEDFFNKNYHAAINDMEDKYRTVKKQENINEYSGVGCELRMLLIQALTIESYINASFDEQP